jgi:hypothetical protein
MSTQRLRTAKFLDLYTMAQRTAIPKDSYVLQHPAAVAAKFGAGDTYKGGFYAECFKFYDYDLAETEWQGFTQAQLTHRFAHAFFATSLISVEQRMYAMSGTGHPLPASDGEKTAAHLMGVCPFRVGDSPGGIWKVVKQSRNEIALEWHYSVYSGLTTIGARRCDDSGKTTLFVCSAHHPFSPDDSWKDWASLPLMKVAKGYTRSLMVQTHRQFVADVALGKAFPHAPKKY